MALPFQKQLCDEISQSIALALLNGLTVTDIAIVYPEKTYRVIPNIISNLPLHCTSSGKIFLAYMSDKKLDQLFNTLKLKAYTDKTITDWNILKIQIEDIRRDDVAYDEEEFMSGVRSIAAPIKNEDGKALATFSIVSPSSLLTNNMNIEELVLAIKSYTLKASRSFGHKEA